MDAPVAVPDAPPDDPCSNSSGGLSVASGTGITLWGACDTKTEPHNRVALEIAPDRPVIIGRAEGHDVPYLDPAYRATRVMPGTGQSVMQADGHGKDIMVSRGHFMLRSAPGGITFVNGVPGREGGIRPPLNWTWLITPVNRCLAPAEEYLIEHGAAIMLYLPNGSYIQIDAR